jgi:hypothetical protein
MNSDNEPVAVVPEVEDDKAVHVVRIGKACPQLKKVLPSSRFHNTNPGSNLLGSLTMFLRRLLKAFDCDDAHCSSVLRNLRSVNLK